MKLENINNLDIDFPEFEYPEIELERKDLKLIVSLKKDYSKIEDIQMRKNS